MVTACTSYAPYTYNPFFIQGKTHCLTSICLLFSSLCKDLITIHTFFLITVYTTELYGCGLLQCEYDCQSVGSHMNFSLLLSVNSTPMTFTSHLICLTHTQSLIFILIFSHFLILFKLKNQSIERVYGYM
jgi:hypothetical protein